MELDTRKLSIMQVMAQLQDNDLLLQIEGLLHDKAKELFYGIEAQHAQQVMGVSQKPRKVKTDLEKLAEEQGYKPRKQSLIGALPKDELSFSELSKMIGK